MLEALDRQQRETFGILSVVTRFRRRKNGNDQDHGDDRDHRDDQDHGDMQFKGVSASVFVR